MTREHDYFSGSTIETLQSVLWPEISAKIWHIGDCWFCQCCSGNFPSLAKTQNFPSRDKAIEHAKIVLAI